MSSEIAIKVENLSKCYHIYETPRDRLKQFVLPRLQRLLGLHPKRYYREFWALKDVSFEVKKGETLGVVGRNGSGKSTLLQLICGTLNPTHGNIKTHGRIAALLELGSGFNPEFTGRENVYLNGAVLGLSRAAVEARFDAIAAFADIGQFIDQPVKTYSSGMLVRLAFAVIAHVDADILIVDEALAVGDVFFNQKCIRFLRNFMAKKTVVFVSHDTGAVVNLCNKAILLSEGSLLDVGHPGSITERYLAEVYQANQDISGVLTSNTQPWPEPAERISDYRDMREAQINGSTLRNDIEVFAFEPDKAGFGNGNAKITSVRLLDQTGAPLSWIVGGENVVLEICCVALKEVLQPIVGFQLKDRLGQVVFCDNTYLAFQKKPVPISVGAILDTRFEFRLPVLPTGNYTISPAIADGTQAQHVQLHWIHDALAFKVHASSVVLGLVGLQVRNITMEPR